MPLDRQALQDGGWRMRNEVLGRESPPALRRCRRTALMHAEDALGRCAAFFDHRANAPVPESFDGCAVPRALGAPHPIDRAIIWRTAHHAVTQRWTGWVGVMDHSDVLERAVDQTVEASPVAGDADKYKGWR